MIFAIIDLIIVFALLGLLLFVTACTSLLEAFLLHIDFMNAGCLGIFAGIWLYCSNRYYETIFNFDVHPAICIGVGAAVFGLVWLIECTKVGFWIFAAIMSIAWAFVLAIVVHFFLHDALWFWVVFVIATLINVNSHFRAWRLKGTIWVKE